MSDEFLKAAEKVRNFSTRPPDKDFLEFYSLYKQATVGDCNTNRPASSDTQGIAKWEAWNCLKGVSKVDAEKRYIAKAASFKA